MNEVKVCWQDYKPMDSDGYPQGHSKTRIEMMSKDRLKEFIKFYKKHVKSRFKAKDDQRVIVEVCIDKDGIELEMY